MTIAALALAALTTLTAGAATGAAKAPASFYGVVPQTALGSSDSRAHGRRQGRHLARSWVNWAAIDRTARRRQRLGQRRPDRARGGRATAIEVLPFIFGTPQLGGARTSTTATAAAPSASLYGAEVGRRRWTPGRAFVGEAVDRYGPNGDVLGRAPGGRPRPDPRVADLERAELEELLRAEAEPEGLREAAQAAATRRDQVPRRGAPTWSSAGWRSWPARAKAIPGSEYLADLYEVKGAKQELRRASPRTRTGRRSPRSSSPGRALPQGR